MSEPIPSSQKSAVYYKANGPITFIEQPVPEVPPNDVLVKIAYSGVCYSDLSIWAGLLGDPFKSPIVAGHEGTGIVVKLGANVKKVKLGERVGIKWINSTCLNCEFCRNSYESNCSESTFTGYTQDGTFQQYTLVREHEAIKIPDNVDLAEAAPILCAGVTVYKALKVSELRAGQIMAITGAGGGLGSLAIQYAKAMGFRVLAIDAAQKEEFCRSLGAEWFVDPFSVDNLTETIKEITNGGPHGVLNVANSIHAINESVKYVRTRGSVVVVALPKGAKMEVDVLDLVLRVIQIRTSYIGNREDAYEALDFVARKEVKVSHVVRPFDQLVPTLEEMKSGKLQGRVVLDLWK